MNDTYDDYLRRSAQLLAERTRQEAMMADLVATWGIDLPKLEPPTAEAAEAQYPSVIERQPTTIVEIITLRGVAISSHWQKRYEMLVMAMAVITMPPALGDTRFQPVVR
jgi:hypothetical protein